MNLETRVAALERTVAKQAAAIQDLERLLKSPRPAAEPRQNQKPSQKANGNRNNQPLTRKTSPQVIDGKFLGKTSGESIAHCEYGLNCGKEFCRFGHTTTYCTNCLKHGVTWASVANLDELRNVSYESYVHHITSHGGYQYASCWMKGACRTCKPNWPAVWNLAKMQCTDRHACRSNTELNFFYLKADFERNRRLREVLGKIGKEEEYDAWAKEERERKERKENELRGCIPFH
jgi:hypothetical protein